jgi:hypothetical protein
MILTIKMNEFNDAKNAGKREVKKSPGLMHYGKLLIVSTEVRSADGWIRLFLRAMRFFMRNLL